MGGRCFGPCDPVYELSVGVVWDLAGFSEAFENPLCLGEEHVDVVAHKGAEYDGVEVVVQVRSVRARLFVEHVDRRRTLGVRVVLVADDLELLDGGRRTVVAEEPESVEAPEPLEILCKRRPLVGRPIVIWRRAVLALMMP